jgi:predicted nucleotidyltransferase
MPKTLSSLQALEDKIIDDLNFLRSAVDLLLDHYNSKEITLEQLRIDMANVLKGKSVAERQLEGIKKLITEAYLRMETSKIRRGF